MCIVKKSKKALFLKNLQRKGILIFLIAIVFVVFSGLVRDWVAIGNNVVQKKKLEKEKAKIKNTKECPYCLSTVPIKATKCAFCTSDLNNVNETKSKENAEDSAKSNEKIWH